jgi:uncharacterized protein involved in response to NO
MTTSAQKMRDYRGPAVFSFGFRPFFFAGAVTAAIIPLVTALAVTRGGAPLIADPIAYHRHEMIFGYLGAVIAGFVLTAVPNWTGRLPVIGARLAGLVALWVAGRAAFVLAGGLAPPVVAVVSLAFPAALALVVWREVLAGRNWRNIPVAGALSLLFISDVVWHAGAEAFGARMGVGVVALLVALIGGRITPSFTRNWLARRGGETSSMSVGAVDRIALVLTATAVTAWMFAPQSALTGGAALCACLAILVRLAGWRGWLTFTEPLVLILHIGYLWLAVGFGVMSLAAFDGALMQASAAMHALTAGAFGVMTLAVMTRATRGHTGRAMAADRVTVLIYAMVNVGAFIRVSAPILPIGYNLATLAAAVFWCGAFLLFAAAYGPYLFAPRVVR